MVITWFTHQPQDNLSEQKDVRQSQFIPMVYEPVSHDPITWEYRVLTVDVREHDLPSEAQLNELGSQGWLLAGLLHAEQHGIAHYYFLRLQRA